MSAMVARGGIDLGGTKIQAVVVDGTMEGARPVAPPDPDQGRPGGRRRAMAEALREAALEAGMASRPSSPAAGVGSPGDVNEATGAVVAGAQPAGLGRHASRSAEALREALGTPVAVGNDVQVATDAEFELGAGRHYKSLLGVFWGTGVGGGIILDGEPWLGRGAAGEIGHMVVKQNGAPLPVRAARLPGGLRGASGDGGQGPRASTRRGKQDRPLQDHGEARPRPADQRHLGARALTARTTRSPSELIDRAVEALGAGDRLGLSTCSTSRP